eukprot:SAG31_NODE_7793_length_1595_cov_0.798797_3_plen_64_part_01
MISDNFLVSRGFESDWDNAGIEHENGSSKQHLRASRRRPASSQVAWEPDAARPPKPPPCLNQIA